MKFEWIRDRYQEGDHTATCEGMWVGHILRIDINTGYSLSSIQRMTDHGFSEKKPWQCTVLLADVSKRIVGFVATEEDAKKTVEDVVRFTRETYGARS